MSSFRYTGPESRYYPTLGIEALPDQVIDLPSDAPDDGRWLPVSPGSATVTVTAPVAAPDPAPEPAAPAADPNPPADPAPAAEAAPDAAPEVSA